MSLPPLETCTGYEAKSEERIGLHDGASMRCCYVRYMGGHFEVERKALDRAGLGGIIAY